MATKATIKKPQNSLLKPIGYFFRRFHMLAFFILIVSCAAAAIILINKALTESADDQYTSSINAGTIDQATLERIQSLHTSDQASEPPQLPDGRVNPFAE